MYRGFRIAVVMPAFNVERELAAAIGNVPNFVDDVIVVDDASTDRTPDVARATPRVGLRLQQHSRNRGVGAAIATGYQEALAAGADAVCVMAGDGQMDGRDLPSLLDPLVDGTADYVKGNRFLHPHIRRAMPRCRYFGNIILSILTRVSSGYRHVFDSQCGYTAMSRATLLQLGMRFFPRYGYPNDVLARLRVASARVMDVCVRPVYEGQRSGIRLWTVFYPMLFVIGWSFIVRVGRSWLSRRRMPAVFGLIAKLRTEPGDASQI